MKKVKDYLMMLPEPYRSKAFNYALANMTSNIVSYSLSDSMSTAFKFIETKEGAVYWANVYYNAQLYTLKHKFNIFRPILLNYNFYDIRRRNYAINLLYTLPEPYKTKALINHKKFNGKDENNNRRYNEIS